MELDPHVAWKELSGPARDVLSQLCRGGPAWDGNIVSKSGRDELLERGYAVRIIMGTQWSWRALTKCEEGAQGYQAATQLGYRVYKEGSIRRGSLVPQLGDDNAGDQRGVE